MQIKGYNVNNKMAGLGGNKQIKEGGICSLQFLVTKKCAGHLAVSINKHVNFIRLDQSDFLKESRIYAFELIVRKECTTKGRNKKHNWVFSNHTAKPTSLPCLNFRGHKILKHNC